MYSIRKTINFYYIVSYYLFINSFISVIYKGMNNEKKIYNVFNVW